SVPGSTSVASSEASVASDSVASSEASESSVAAPEVESVSRCSSSSPQPMKANSTTVEPKYAKLRFMTHQCSSARTQAKQDCSALGAPAGHDETAAAARSSGAPPAGSTLRQISKLRTLS